MSWFHPYENVPQDGHASVPEVLACFRQQRNVLLRFAVLITGDQATAEHSLEKACELTLKGHAPFREWLTQWARVATVTTAISHCIAAIRECEAMYKDQRCPHAEHVSLIDDAERERRLNALIATDPDVLISQLDPLSRALLVLRVATESSIQDCVLRLNVSRPAVLAANCAAMTWLMNCSSKEADGQECLVEAQAEER